MCCRLSLKVQNKFKGREIWRSKQTEKENETKREGAKKGGKERQRNEVGGYDL